MDFKRLLVKGVDWENICASSRVERVKIVFRRKSEGRSDRRVADEAVQPGVRKLLAAADLLTRVARRVVRLELEHEVLVWVRVNRVVEVLPALRVGFPRCLRSQARAFVGFYVEDVILVGGLAFSFLASTSTLLPRLRPAVAFSLFFLVPLSLACLVASRVRLRLLGSRFGGLDGSLSIVLWRG